MTANQPGLPFAPTLAEAARRWIDEHPVAMGHYRRFARQMLERGRRFGIGLLTERVRWECAVGGDGREDFRINNNWRPYIARELVREIPELDELLECRVTPAANRPPRSARRAPVADPRA
jgi:hypothetical protein